MRLIYYDNIEDVPISDHFRQARIKYDNQLTVFSGFTWQYFPDNHSSTGAIIVFYQGISIDHCKNVPVPVAQYSAESKYNSVCTTGMNLPHFMMINNEIMNKYTYIFPEQAPITILDRNPAVCMAKSGKETKNTIYSDRIMHFVRNGEGCNMHKTV